jgi:transposase, IS30 family
MKTYLCNPNSPWQKGQVKKTNAILHRYIPNKTCAKKLTPKLIEWTQDMLNNLPRKCLGFKTTMETFYGKKYSFVALQT